MTSLLSTVNENGSRPGLRDVSKTVPLSSQPLYCTVTRVPLLISVPLPTFLSLYFRPDCSVTQPVLSVALTAGGGTTGGGAGTEACGGALSFGLATLIAFVCSALLPQPAISRARIVSGINLFMRARYLHFSHVSAAGARSQMDVPRSRKRELSPFLLECSQSVERDILFSRYVLWGCRFGTMIRVGIIGASGYAGAELVRYLLGHPGARISYLASETYAGRPLSDAFGSFLGQDLPDCESYDAGIAADRCDLIFQAQGNGVGIKLAPELLACGKKLIDVPADFRLKDLAQYKQYYGADHTAADLVAEAVYGIPELRAAQIAEGRLVANPGCYATSAILALAPLVSGGMVAADSIVVDSKSGVSGAGRSRLDVSGLFCETNEGFRAYAVGSHRHTPEIEQELSRLAGDKITISFTPHLVPMNRGILTTAYGRAPGIASTTGLIAIYKEFYAGKPFVVVLDEAAQPNTKNVFGANFCHIGAVLDKRAGRAIVTCAIDNMGKGAAGQAVQNMNLMCGFDETAGLMSPAVYP